MGKSITVIAIKTSIQYTQIKPVKKVSRTGTPKRTKPGYTDACATNHLQNL